MAAVETRRTKRARTAESRQIPHDMWLRVPEG